MRGEANGPLNVGRELTFGLKKVDNLTETWSSTSVKGKKDLARNKVAKWASKPATDMGKGFPNKSSAWVLLGKEGEGECSDDLFHFTANGRTEVGFQACRQSSGVLVGGSASSRDGLVRREAGASVESTITVDGNQCKGGSHSVNTSEVRNKPNGDVIGAENTHILNGESVLSEDHTCD